MKLNQEKCHLVISGHKHESIWAKIGQTKIWESRKQKLLGVEVDSSLNFVSSLCEKAGKKFSVLARLCIFISLNQRQKLMETFIESQFGYCPLVWMFHGRIVNKKKLTIRMKGLYELFIQIIQVLFKTYLKEIILSLFIIGTFTGYRAIQS